MNEKALETKKNTGARKGIPSVVLLIAAALLACGAALLFRESAGFWRTVPVLPLFMAVAAFLPLPWWQRALLFLVPVIALNAVEQNDVRVILLLSVLAAVLFGLIEAGAYLIRTRKKAFLRLICGILLLCLAFAVYAFVCGNPVSAARAESAVNAYIDRTYERDGLKFSGITYDIFTRRYVVRASSGSFPTESAALSVNGPIVEDGFLPLLEDQTMRAPAASFARALRLYFPEATFTVYRVSVSGFDRDLPHRDSALSSAGENANYCVELYGSPTYDKMAKTAETYASVLASSGVAYRSVRFVSAQTFRVRYRASAVPAGYVLTGYGELEPGVFAVRSADMLQLLEKYGLEDACVRFARAGSASR